MDDERMQLRLLEREIWDLLLYDGGIEVEELKKVKTREDRRGRMKRMLCSAIEKSSLGTFGGKIHHFGGKTYVPLDRYAFQGALFNICSKRINVPDADLVRMSDIYQDCNNVVFSRPLRISQNVMIFRNGVLDVEKDRFYKTFDKRFVQLWSVDYDYVKGVQPYLWRKFLDQVLPDPYWQRSLQMFLGATFVDRSKVKIEHIVILLGKGANGKSVIQQAVCGVLGDEYVSTMEVGRLCSRGMDGDMAVAEINGKRLNYCTEMEETDFYKKSARLKAIVSGEAVTARQLYGTPFKAMNIPLLMANANRLPFFNSRDDAMLRRIYVIPFNVVIPDEEQDKELGDKLAVEYPAILNWILEGRRMFVENGYRLPRDTSIGKYLQDEQNEFNSVMRFMSTHRYLATQEGTSIEPVVWRTASDLYGEYYRWCKQNYMTEIVTKVIFMHMLEDNGYKKDRKSKGISFALYGNSKERIKKMIDKMSHPSKNDPNITWLDGVGYVPTMSLLLKYTGVSRHVMLRVKGNGYLDECIRQYDGKVFYNVSGVVEVLRRMHIIATDEQLDADRAILQQQQKERNRFNSRMKARGWPYRKYKTTYEHLDDGIVVVEDSVTDEECVRMAEEAGYDTGGIYGEMHVRPKPVGDEGTDEEQGNE